jgi:uncharacterized protein (TIGR01777 family)
MTIILAGGSGFLGRALHRHLTAAGHAVIVLSRHAASHAGQVQWQPDGSSGTWARALIGADAIVNLAGESIAGKRWTAARKQILRTSRVLPARSIARALAELPARPRILVTGSAIGYYGAHGDEAVTEATPPGTDFLARLCVEWEQEAAAAASSTTQVALVRTGIVLHPAGGALKPMLLPFRYGVGGPLGTGRQYWSWIHLADWVALVAWLATAAAPVTGQVTAWNATAPTPVTNAEFARVLGRVLHRPAAIPTPVFALLLALGEFSSALTTGARVLPARAERAGYQFRYTALEPALRDLFAATAS